MTAAMREQVRVQANRCEEHGAEMTASAGFVARDSYAGLEETDQHVMALY